MCSAQPRSQGLFPKAREKALGTRLCSAGTCTIECPKGARLIQVSLHENSLPLFDKGSLEYFNYAVII